MMNWIKKAIPLDRDVLDSLTKLSISITLIWMIQQLYSAVDMIIVGRVIGEHATAAVATASDFTNVMSMIATAIAGGASVYISQLKGADDRTNLRQAIGTTIVLMCAFAALSVGYVLLFRDRYLAHLNCPPEALQDARSYLLITGCALPFIFAYTGIISIMKAMGNGRNPLLFAVAACILNFTGDVILVIVLHMGVTGSAIATAASQLICCLMSWHFLSSVPSLFKEQSLIRFLRIEGNATRRIMRMAVPQMIRILLVQFSFLFLRGKANSYGLLEAATYSIWFKMERFFNSIVFGVQEASCNIIGQMIGAGRYDQVKPTVRYTIVLGLVGTVIPLILFMAFPKSLARLFTNEEAVVNQLTGVMSILAVGLFVNAFGNGSKGISVGAGNALISFFVGVLDAGARIAVAFICIRMLGIGVNSCYWGMALAPVFPGILCIAYLYSERWRYRKRLSET